MNRLALCLLALLSAPLSHADPGNPAIDAEAHLVGVIEAMDHRSTHRISESEFFDMSRKPGATVLDARSREKFALQMKNSTNASRNFSLFTAASRDLRRPSHVST